MQITHEEARRLIQFNADEALNPQQKTVLLMHIKTCLECRVYAEEIKEVESILLPVMKKEWSRRPLPLSSSALKVQTSGRLTSNILAIRTAIISFVFVAFAVSTWQFMHSGQQVPALSPVAVSSVPTPSAAYTSTTITTGHCDVIYYNVQANDTLAGLADQFSISKDEIMSMNNLKTETIKTGMTLLIPSCNFTPTSTIWPTSTTTTLTPVTNSVTSSPEPDRY
jgi:LysM repeat protein